LFLAVEKTRKASGQKISISRVSCWAGWWPEKNLFSRVRLDLCHVQLWYFCTHIRDSTTSPRPDRRRAVFACLLTSQRIIQTNYPPEDIISLIRGVFPSGLNRKHGRYAKISSSLSASPNMGTIAVWQLAVPPRARNKGRRRRPPPPLPTRYTNNYAPG